MLSAPTTNTPSTSRLPTCFVGAPAPERDRGVALGSVSFSRTVSAMIGIESTCLRVSVMTLAVAEKSGRVSGGGLSS